MIRWLFSSAKETVTPEGIFGSAVLEPKFNPMASRIAKACEISLYPTRGRCSRCR